MKKDFSQVHNAIAAATQEAQEERRPRRTYTAQEAAEFLQNMKTSGRKGLKLPRINLAFQKDVYDYVQTMSRVRGETMTEFVNLALRQHMTDNKALYEKAIEFKKSL